MKRLIQSTGLFLLVTSVHAQPISGSDKKNLEFQIYTKCTETQAAAPENNHLTAKQITNFCECVSETVVKNVTMKDIRQAENGNVQMIVRKREEAVAYCLPAAQMRN